MQEDRHHKTDYIIMLAQEAAKYTHSGVDKTIEPFLLNWNLRTNNLKRLDLNVLHDISRCLISNKKIMYT